MKISEAVIRPINCSDNESVRFLIRTVLDELGVPRKGTTYADKELDNMYLTFSKARSAYFVVEEESKIIGGGGIIRLKKEKADVCELQKMYLLPEARGRGIGRRLLEICLKAAIDLNYRSCYLETMSDMHVAMKMYEQAGFRYLEKRMGDTGHYVCPIWMIIDLEDLANETEGN